MSAISGFLSANLQADAAEDAADAQQAASEYAADTQYQLGMAWLEQQQAMYDQALQLAPDVGNPELLRKKGLTYTPH